MMDIYRMDLHEQGKVAENLWVTRVPDGWIYTTSVGGGNNVPVVLSSVFVPDNQARYRDEGALWRGL